MWQRVFSILKNRIKMVIIIFMACALFLGYFIGRVNNSRDNVITRLEIALKNEDVKALSSMVTINDKKVSKEKLEPLIEYYKENTQAIDNDMKSLRSGENTSVFSIKDKKKVFGNAYYVQLKVYNVKVNSNYMDGEFTIDNKSFIKGGESMENIVPGVYTINGILKSQYGDIQSSKDFVLMKDENVWVNFDAVNITINSIFKDADVYIDNEYTGMTVNDAEDLGPFNVNSSIPVYIEKEFPWGTIKGDEAYITDVPVLNLSINMKNDKMEKEIENTAEEFYKSVFEALNKEEKSFISGAEESVKDKIYSILEKRYTFLKNNYNINDIEIMNDKSEYTYEDDMYKANVVVKVEYSIEKSFFGLDKEGSSKMFFTKFIYDEDKNQWIVNDVENFSL